MANELRIRPGDPVPTADPLYVRKAISSLSPQSLADSLTHDEHGRRLSTAGTMRVMLRMAERAMVRASDSPQVRGNTAHLLTGSREAFAAWLTAINAAQRYVHLENYIIRDDRIGRRFRDVLCERARDGV